MQIKTKDDSPQAQDVLLILLLCHGRTAGHFKLGVDFESRKIVHEEDGNEGLFKALKTFIFHPACQVEGLRGCGCE